MRYKIRQRRNVLPMVEPGNGNSGSRGLSTAVRQWRRSVAAGASGMLGQKVPALTSGAMITSATDPRWVFALQVAGQLQGVALPLDQREKLERTAKVMGLTVFNANLIIAIVQDSARRGVPALECPAVAEAQLGMVGLSSQRRRATWLIVATVGLVLVLEVLSLLLIVKL